MAGVCEECGKEAEFCDSVPDPTQGGDGEFCYRYKPLCYLHMLYRKMYVGNTTRIKPVLVGDDGRAYVDFDRASGLCVCPACGRDYYSHPQFKPAPFLNQLCDGTLVKL